MVDLQDRFAIDVDGSLAERGHAGGAHVFGATPEHQRHDVERRRLGRRERRHEFAAAQDRDAVRQLEVLIHAVADVHESDAALAQPFDHGEENRDFGRIERRRRLVHDDEARIERDRARESDHLLHRDAQTHDGHVEVDRHTERLDDPRSVAPHRLPVEVPETAARLAA